MFVQTTQLTAANINTASGGDYCVGGRFLGVVLDSAACDWLLAAILGQEQGGTGPPIDIER